MARQDTIGKLYDPRTGGRSIRAERLHLVGQSHDPPRTNYFAVYRIESGSGAVWADAARFHFDSNSLIFLVPYQRVRFMPEGPVLGDVVYFHANFLCVETFHAEVGCSGILFNDPYAGPVVPLGDSAAGEVSHLLDRLRREQDGGELASGDVMLAYLKVVLILATRLKSAPAGVCGPGIDPRHPILARLRELIEEHYRTWHSPADYADALHLTPKTLGRIVRDHLGTTPTELIRSRILTHAKWELLHTLRSVKEVARELGFSDELYFSRLFKKATGYSPTFFREFETAIRGGSNLSMPSSHTPILHSTPRPDN